MHTNKPTARQVEILTFINQCYVNWGYPPTARDIAKEFGWTSGGAHYHLDALVRLNLIVRDPGVARGIRVL